MSLVPHATELLFALGLGDRLVGVTHGCDHPAEARGLPRLTSSAVPHGLDAAGIDAAVSGLARDGAASDRLDADLLERLRPDLVITQALCSVCAVSHDEVVALARDLPASGLFARPGPRLVDGLELLAHVLHPDRVPAPAGDVLDVPRTTTRARPGARA